MAQWSNWSGLVQCHAERVAMPRTLEELQSVIREAGQAGKTVRATGSGHSFTDLVKTHEIILSLDHLSGMVAADIPARLGTVWAGTKLWRLNELLDQHQLAMENLGDINKQSIAGAVGTGTHGTGIQFGNLSSQVAGFSLVTATGEIMECSSTENTDVFMAGLVSMGSLGVMARLQLRLVPAYRMRYVRRRENFDEMASNLGRYRENNRQFEFYFFPYTEVVQLKFLNETHEPPTKRRLTKWFNDVILENATVEALSRISTWKPDRCAGVSRFMAQCLASGEEVNAGHAVLSTTRMVRFNEMEYAVPAEAGIECMRELKAWIEQRKIAVHFPIEFRYVKGDGIWLSPCYGRDTACISIHMYHRMPHEAYFEGAEQIFLRYGGRPHWGKLHSLSSAELASKYDKWDDFQRVRARLDPKGTFTNEYLARVLGPVRREALAEEVRT